LTLPGQTLTQDQHRQAKKSIKKPAQAVKETKVNGIDKRADVKRSPKYTKTLVILIRVFEKLVNR